MTKVQESQDTNFETAFVRLETILQKMNSGTITLDESLKLYEEADGLIGICGKKLNDAERKIETLIKNRSGEIITSGDGKPQIQAFSPNHPSK